jgi:hypothetical protein
VSLLSSLGQFELFNAKDMLKKIKKDPERLLLGAVDPLSTKMWSGITGKKMSPLVDQMGGPEGGSTISAFGNADGGVYKRAEDAGIDTKAGRGMNNAAHVLSALFAGGYGLGQLGGGGQAAQAANGQGLGIFSNGGQGGMAGVGQGNVGQLAANTGINTGGVGGVGSTGAQPAWQQLVQQNGLGSMPGMSTGAPPQQPPPQVQQRQAPEPPPTIGQRMMGGLGRARDALTPIDPRIASQMDPEHVKQLRNQAIMQMGLGMMGSASRGGGFGEALATGIGLGQAGLNKSTEGVYERGVTERELKRDEDRYSEMQKPAQVREYEYAVANGYKGSYKDWTTAAGQTSRPSSVQEWEFFSQLSADEQQRYLEMKRNPNFVVKDVNQAPTAIVGLPGGGVRTMPLSTTQSEAEAAGLVKGSESQAGAIGTGLGNIQAGIQTKGANAQTVTGMLDIADPLIEVATGSTGGAAYDAAAKFFGKAPDGAQAIASLQVLQAGLMTNMPRMEGPQSDRDVDLYRQAAGQIGDPTVPRDIKKAAVKTIRELQKKYADRASGNNAPAKEPTLDEIRKKYGR